MIVSGIYVDIALQALRGYAVIILCFVGAIHWGRSMFQLRVSTVTASVVPASFTFVCLLLPLIYALPLLVIGFIALFLYDYHEYADLDGFIQLCLPLSLLFIFCLSAVWLIIRKTI